MCTCPWSGIKAGWDPIDFNLVGIRKSTPKFLGLCCVLKRKIQRLLKIKCWVHVRFMFMSGLGRNSGRRVVLFILFVFERGEIWWNLSVEISMFRGRILYIHMHLISKGFKNRTQQRWCDLSICLFTLSAYQYIYIYKHTLPRQTSSRLFSEMCFLCGFTLGFRLYAMLVVKVSIWRHPEDQVFYFEEL